MQIELPGGQSAEIRDKPTVGGRDLLQEEGAGLFSLLAQRFPDLAEFKDVNIADFDRPLMAAFHRFNRAAVVALLKSWTLTLPVPTMDTIVDLDADVYDAIGKAVAPLVLRIMTAEYLNKDEPSDPSTPSVPSFASSEGGPAPTTLTTTPPSGFSKSTPSTATVA